MAANTMHARVPGVALLSALVVGCNSVPMSQFRAAQYQSVMSYRQLVHANQSVNQLQSELGIANQRLANLGAEREELTTRYSNLLASLQSGDNPLGGGATKRFEELARKYPEFEFDPYTGVSKFTGDLLFASGSADIQSTGQPLLQEFARIMNDADARQFNILVVGHTDDRNVTKATTKNKHANNWELSAHRATAVVGELSRYGLDEHRLGIAGYSKFQPAAPNSTEASRQQNRRVEIFIMAPDALIAGIERQPYF